MPTITFYATEEVKEQLDKLTKRRSKLSGNSVSRGNILVPYIKYLYHTEFSKSGNSKKAHVVGQAQPVIVSDLSIEQDDERSEPTSAVEVK